MKSKKISIFFVLIIKSLTLVNLMRTNGNIPQYHSLRSFKIKDYRIKRAKSPVCYNPNCVATYNDILECGDKKKRIQDVVSIDSLVRNIMQPLKNLQAKKLRLLNVQSVTKVV